MAVLQTWLVAYGVPLALIYWKNVYVRAGTDAEITAWGESLISLLRYIALDIRSFVIFSIFFRHLERNHGTHQDRLVKKMRRLDVADDATANTFLTTWYWPASD